MMSDVVANDDDLSTLRVVWSQHHHLECYHGNLQHKRKYTQTVIFLFLYLHTSFSPYTLFRS